MREVGDKEAALWGRAGAQALRQRSGFDPPPHPWSACPELDCLRGRIPPAILAAATERAQALDVGADRVLMAAGVIDEETYVRALAAWLGLDFEALDHRRRSECPLSEEQLIEAGRTGVLPIGPKGAEALTIVPAIADSRSLVRAACTDTGASRRMRLTTSERLNRFVASRAAARIGRIAGNGLNAAHPDLSAAGGNAARPALMMLIPILALALLAAPVATIGTIEALLAAAFLSWTGLRIASMLSPPAHPRRHRRYRDADLPIYTVIVALYREAVAVPGLIAALEELDYPREKLDLKLALESEDMATIDAVRAMRRRLPCEIVIAPREGPKTKPKALNAALLSARGAMIAIYDAEDRPEPNQLRLALETFATGDERLACVQARLTIDNTADTWLTRLFTAEYAGLFDVLLPGLAHWHMPLPLGGSSNHFRTQVLRDVGAWDAYNVTEDADLGMRLARFGYTTQVIPSTTYEEAPGHLGPWLKQRTRWFKGWIQTWLVHMRRPVSLLRELGLGNFIAFQLIVGGAVLAALVHGAFVLALAFAAATGHLTGFPELHASALMAGYLVSAALGLMGLARRGLLRDGWIVILIPVYWVLLSLAAWRALYQFATDPHRWEKTEHGLARTSRLAEGIGSGRR